MSTEHRVSNSVPLGEGTSAPSDGELSFTRPYIGHNGARSGKLTEGDRVVFSGYIPRDAGAAKIVTSWNAHAPLVDALEAILPWHDSHPAEPTNNPVIQQCRAALARARGQS